MDASNIVADDPRVQRLLADLAGLGGVARRTVLRARGHADRTVAQAVTAGLARKEGRLWLALPHANPDLRAAARSGVLLTCVTAAVHRGLWTLEHSHRHVAVRRHGERPRVSGSTVVHWAKPIVPRHPDALVDQIENVLALTASCLPHEQAITIWESAFRAGLTDTVRLSRLPLGTGARALLAEASSFSDSGLETIFLTRLRWLGVRIVPQAWVHGHRVDFLIGERLVIQIDGGHHIDAQRLADNRHDAELLVRGYHVIRIGYAEVLGDWPAVQLLIMHAVAQGLHRAA